MRNKKEKINTQIIPNTKKFKLGNHYRDNVSGWEGVATSYHVYMNGCVRVALSNRDKEGKPADYIFDVEQISLLDKPPIIKTKATPTGGPRDNTPIPR